MTADVSEAGYATLGYPAALDLTGIDAYTVTASGDKAYLNPIPSQQIPDNTGIVLKGSGTVTIPLTFESDEVGDNDLKVSDGTVQGDASTIHVLANGMHGVGFYLLQSGDIVPAGKAYLAARSNSRGFIGFGDDDTTAISEKIIGESGESASAQYYNLQGQRVSEPTKGIYIIDSRKTIRK